MVGISSIPELILPECKSITSKCLIVVHATEGKGAELILTKQVVVKLN